MEKQKFIKNSEPSVKLGEINFTPMYISLVVIFISIILLFLWKKKSPKRTDLLLVGLCESGKTVMFSHLVHGSDSIKTFTSITENVGDCLIRVGGKVLRIVDIPGHERLRGRIFDNYKNTAKGLIFVIDSLTVQKDIRDVADYLYTILSDPCVSSIPILIACNKQDETFSKDKSVIKSLLEKELNLVRKTRQNQLKTTENSTSDAVYVGKHGKDFEFAHISQYVEFIEYSGKYPSHIDKDWPIWLKHFK